MFTLKATSKRIFSILKRNLGEILVKKTTFSVDCKIKFKTTAVHNIPGRSFLLKFIAQNRPGRVTFAQIQKDVWGFGRIFELD
jgi:hypothetical protein